VTNVVFSKQKGTNWFKESINNIDNRFNNNNINQLTLTCQSIIDAFRLIAVVYIAGKINIVQCLHDKYMNCVCKVDHKYGTSMLFTLLTSFVKATVNDKAVQRYKCVNIDDQNQPNYDTHHYSRIFTELVNGSHSQYLMGMKTDVNDLSNANLDLAEEELFLTRLTGSWINSLQQ
jgi:hypothetical protein